jgi:phosphatidylserine/phosphatidylglycerophosphate/cardiolipin synthase-like enzyme
MGFKARSAILEVLDEAIADKKAQVRAVVYDLNEPVLVSRLERLGKRLKIIIDDDGAHGKKKSAETNAAKRLAATAEAANVKRQHMGKLQHNKTIVVDGPRVQAAICGSTNHSWRGFFVQNNNAIILRGKEPVKLFLAAFEDYFLNDDVAGFGKTGSATWNDLGVAGIDAEIGFSPRAKENAVLDTIATDIAKTTSSLFFSLAFLYQTKGKIKDAFTKIKKDNQIFTYGISDHKVKGLEEAAGVDVQKPNGKVAYVHPERFRGMSLSPSRKKLRAAVARGCITSLL